MIFVRSFLNIRSVSCPGAAGGVSDWGDFLCKYIFLVTSNWFIHHSFIVTYFTIKVYWSSLLIIDNYKLWTMHYSTNEHKNSNGCSLCKVYIPTINHLLEQSSVLKVNNKMIVELCSIPGGHDSSWGRVSGVSNRWDEEMEPAICVTQVVIQSTLRKPFLV